MGCEPNPRKNCAGSVAALQRFLGLYFRDNFMDPYDPDVQVRELLMMARIWIRRRADEHAEKQEAYTRAWVTAEQSGVATAELSKSGFDMLCRKFKTNNPGCEQHAWYIKFKNQFEKIYEERRAAAIQERQAENDRIEQARIRNEERKAKLATVIEQLKEEEEETFKEIFPPLTRHPGQASSLVLLEITTVLLRRNRLAPAKRARRHEGIISPRHHRERSKICVRFARWVCMNIQFVHSANNGFAGDIATTRIVVARGNALYSGEHANAIASTRVQHRHGLTKESRRRNLMEPLTRPPRRYTIRRHQRISCQSKLHHRYLIKNRSLKLQTMLGSPLWLKKRVARTHKKNKLHHDRRIRL